MSGCRALAEMASEDVSHLVSQKTIEKAVKNFVNNEPFSIQKTRVTRATDEVQGFTSIILRVSVDLTVGGKVRTVSLIVKRLPIVEAQLKLISGLRVFEREAFYYKTVVPQLKKYCAPPLPLPAFYLGECDGSNDILVLEDLQCSNFKTIGFEASLGLQHCRLVMRELARLHAASVAVEKQEGVKLSDLFPIFKEDFVFSESNPIMKSIVHESAQVIFAVCVEMSEYEHLLPALKNKLDTMREQFQELVKPRTDQMNVLCHGDCWFNNMMFRFDDNGQPLDVKFIDLQVPRYASPFLDILYFLYMSLDISSIKQFLNDVLEEYILSFNKCIVKFNIPLKPLQMEQVKKDYNAVRLFGVLTYSYIKPLKLMKEEFVPTNHSEVDDKFEKMFFGEKVSAAQAMFRSNADFRKEMKIIIEELRDAYQL